MANNTSSAVVRELINYANAAADINGALNNEATRLRKALEAFAASCTEYNTNIGPDMAGDLHAYVRRAAPTDEWVRRIGQDFAKADQRPIPSWVIAPLAGAGMLPLAQSRGSGAQPQARAVQTVRGSPNPGPGEALVGSSKPQVRRAAARLIASDPAHPLRFLLGPGGKDFKRHGGFRKGPMLINRPDLVEMSHVVSNKLGGREYVVLEIAWDNQFKNWTIEKPRIGGAVLDQTVVSLKGVGVMKESAKFWESLGWLKPGTVDAAPVVEVHPSPASAAPKPAPRSTATGSVRGSTLLRGASRGLFVAGAALDTYNIATADNKVKESVKVAGGWAGAWAGAKGGAVAGAAIGSIFPGPGTAIGTVVGGVIGGAIGYMAGSKLGEALFDLF